MDNQTFKYKITERASGYTESVRSFDELKFVHILNGSGIWNVNGRDLHVSIDDILIFSKNDERYIKSVTSKEPLTVEQIVFLPVTLYPFQGCADFFFHKSIDGASLLPRDNSFHAALLEDFACIRAEYASDNPWKKEYVTVKIISMVLSAARILFPSQKNAQPIENTPYDTVCRAITYINANLGGDLSRSAIASKLYISPSYLSRIFKEHSGICLQDYIVKQRVQNTVALIKQGKRTIDAAFESGFSSTSGFYRAFYAVTGGKPRDLT